MLETAPLLDSAQIDRRPLIASIVVHAFDPQPGSGSGRWSFAGRLMLVPGERIPGTAETFISSAQLELNTLIS